MSHYFTASALSALFTVGYGLSPASIAAAQSSAPQDEVITTATKIKRSANELGLSVNIVDGTRLDQLDGAEELEQLVPGLQAAVANGSQIAFQIRGIGAVDHQALTPTAAAVYVDGVFQATNVQTSPLLFDLDRVEVLKGPQGSLYGRNATAGAISFVSRRPGDTKEGYVAGEYGRFNRVNLRGAATLPVSDIFSLRVSGRYLSQDPLIENVQTDTSVEAPEEAGGVRDEFGLRAVGRLSPSEATEIIFTAHYAEDNGINPSPRNEGLSLDDHQISVGPDGVQDTDNEFYGLSAEWTQDFGAATLTSLTSYTGYNQQYGFDFAALPGFFGGQTANLGYDRDFTQFAQETRVSWSSGASDFMIGSYLEAEDFAQQYLVWCGRLNRDTLVGSCNYIAAPRRVGAAPTPDGASASTLESLIEQDRKTAALFTYNTLGLSDRLDLVLGGRLTYENIQGSGRGNHIFDNGVVGLNNTLGTDGDGNSIIIGPAIGDNRIKDTNFSGNIGLNYRLNDQWLGYATLSNGFKSGGFNGEVINNAAHFDDEGLFGPETVTSAELGVKFTSPKVQVDLAGFYNDYDDAQARFFQQVTLENGQTIGLNSLSNFDGAISYGLEANAALSPIDGLELTAGLSLLDTEIKDAAQPSLDGDALPFASDVSVTGGLSYERPLSDTVTGRVQLSGKYVSEFTTGADTATAEAFVQDGYSLIDASAALGFGNGFELGIWGRNLGDSDYATSAYRFFGATTFRGAPRTYGVSARVDF